MGWGILLMGKKSPNMKEVGGPIVALPANPTDSLIMHANSKGVDSLAIASKLAKHLPASSAKFSVRIGVAFESPAGIDPKIIGIFSSHALSINSAIPYDFGSDLSSLNANLILLSAGESQAEVLKGISRSKLASLVQEDSKISLGVDTRIPGLIAIGEEEQTAIVSAEFRRKHSCQPDARLNAKVNPSALGEKAAASGAKFRPIAATNRLITRFDGG